MQQWNLKTPGETDKRTASRLRDVAKYSGLAFQIGFVILFGTLLGKKLDAHFALERPIFTPICALGSVFAALYLALKDFIGKKTPR